MSVLSKYIKNSTFNHSLLLFTSKGNYKISCMGLGWWSKLEKVEGEIRRTFVRPVKLVEGAIKLELDGTVFAKIVKDR